MKLKLDRDQLYHYYIIEDHTVKECADYFHVSCATINRNVRQYSFEAKQKLYFLDNATFKYKNKIYYVKDIYNYYIVENNLKTATAKQFGFTVTAFNQIVLHYNILKKSIIDRNRNVSKYRNTKLCQEKIKQTNLRKYGYENVFQVKAIKEKIKHTCLERYGVDVITRSETKKLKEFATKKDRHTFNSSAVEEKYYLILLHQYSKEDIFRQYRDERYPFNCDFYIKSEDLFIELNLHWSHGGHEFDKNSSEDLAKLSIWTERSKSSKYYKNAIEVWTIRDKIKLETARVNNINIKVLYKI